MYLSPSTTAAIFSAELASLPPLVFVYFSQLARWKPPHIHFNGNSPMVKEEVKTTIRSSRRSFTFLLLFPASIAYSPSLSAASLPTLERYTDEVEGFTLLKPSTWAKMEKAGAKALFEEGKGSNNIGVVVSPVRLSTLKEFGTPEFVAEKLIQAERRKESTKHAELITLTERLDHGGRPVYEFEYTIDSTRGGMKRIFSAALVPHQSGIRGNDRRMVEGSKRPITDGDRSLSLFRWHKIILHNQELALEFFKILLEMRKEIRGLKTESSAIALAICINPIGSRDMRCNFVEHQLILVSEYDI